MTGRASHRPPRAARADVPPARADRARSIAAPGLLARLAACLLAVAMPAAADEAPARSERDRVAVVLPGGETWPSRTIRLVVPQAAGGTADLVARMLADRLEPMLGVPIVVDDRPGAGGVIGTEIVRRAPPDGYTWLLASTATHAMAPQVLPSATFDPQRDFTAVANLAWQTKVVLVSAAVPVATLGELVAYARKRPGQLNYASTGVGSSSHLDTELLAAATGIALHHVPYRGSGQTVTAVSVDEVQVLIASVTAALPAIEIGRVRPLAVLSGVRSPLLPSVPTIAEAGVAGLDVRTWLGLVAPAGTPWAIVDELDRRIDRLLESAAVRAWFEAQGLEIATGTPTSFEALIRADVAKWGELARRLGIRAR